jgi:hypothetical protein
MQAEVVSSSEDSLGRIRGTKLKEQIFSGIESRRCDVKQMRTHFFRFE